MKRAFALGVGLIVTGIASAAEPAPPPRAATLGLPLSAAVSSVLPTAPSVPATGYVTEAAPAPASCAPGAACQQREGRPCLQRFWNWLTFQPGPPVLPVFVPKPYRTPIRAYFPCVGCNAVGGCNPSFGHAGGCASAQPGGILPGNTRLGRWGVLSKQTTPATAEPATATPQLPGYRFATPNYPAGNTVPASHTRPDATRPFTNQ
jgi:hypothetical protein